MQLQPLLDHVALIEAEQHKKLATCMAWLAAKLRPLWLALPKHERSLKAKAEKKAKEASMQPMAMDWCYVQVHNMLHWEVQRHQTRGRQVEMCRLFKATERHPASKSGPLPSRGPGGVYSGQHHRLCCLWYLHVGQGMLSWNPAFPNWLECYPGGETIRSDSS